MSIRVLVVDDSALIREVLCSTLAKDGDIEVVGTAEDPLIARRKIKELNPDVVTLDIEMPNMNGLEFLSKLMRLRPTPVVMVSTLTQKGANETMLALELGAVDFVAKPGHDLAGGLDRFGADLRNKVRAAAQSDVRGRAMRASAPALRKVATIARPASGALIAIGASTGGVDAVNAVLKRLPDNCPPVVVTQHMPPDFTERFAHRLNEQLDLNVFEAADRMSLHAGCVYIAKGGFHLSVERSSGEYKCRLSNDDLVSGHRPSVDVMFTSVAKVVGKNAVGAILTGMGRDGAKGLKLMREAGSYTIGQNKGSALVYGMPRAAMEVGALVEEAAVEDIAARLINGLVKSKSAA
ncbi:Chemotaxis response regulator protein-glutamate methylesterase CheB [hydrothermal vent metagenome]|uniref:protein-glutamate methylesterase n=1 Tax=hydrothermal vent metagenome TaxID=652676 RepID=A0A3B0TDG6_9ZZZZ